MATQILTSVWVPAIAVGIWEVVIAVALLAVIAVVAARLIAARTVSKARAEADSILSKAESDAQTRAKQIELDARNEQAKLREAFEKESTETRNELKELERRLAKREDNLDRKLDVLATKEKFLEDQAAKIESREKVAAQKEAEYDRLVAEQRERNEAAAEEQKQVTLRLSHMTEQEARKEAIQLVEREVAHETEQIIARAQERAEEEAREISQKITLQAIQRYASEHTTDATVTAVDIPSDDMKGRVIGREGRNIRAFEKATGVDVIVDDTPGVVVVSCFDPIRRAVASEALRKLIEDGRIHPSRIEEIVEQMNKEIQDRIVKYGKDACIEANIQGLHPKISEMMGRLHYRMSYGQNILQHSLEVAFLCQVIANELGLDGDMARRAGFLHDIGKAMDHEMEGGHPQIGAEFCKKLGEKEAVLNAIAGHHNDIPATTPYTPIVMAADAISGARPGARRETLERYVKRLEQLEEIAKQQNGVKEAYAIQAGREVRVVVDPQRVDDKYCHHIAREIAKRVGEEMTFPGEIRVTVLREMRTVEYAR